MKINPKMLIAKALMEIENPAFGELLKATNLSRPALTEHLKDMVEKGLIESVKSEKDKRKIVYKINENEIILFTKEELINAIESTIDRKLTVKEREAIERILVESVRPSFAELIKMYNPSDEIISTKGTIDDVLDLINALIVGYMMFDKFKDLLDLKYNDVEEYSKLFSSTPFMPPLYKGIKYVPESFFKDWIETNVFKSSIAYPLLEFTSKSLDLMGSMKMKNGKDKKN